MGFRISSSPSYLTSSKVVAPVTVTWHQDNYFCTHDDLRPVTDGPVLSSSTKLATEGAGVLEITSEVCEAKELKLEPY